MSKHTKISEDILLKLLDKGYISPIKYDVYRSVHDTSIKLAAIKHERSRGSVNEIVKDVERLSREVDKWTFGLSTRTINALKSSEDISSAIQTKEDLHRSLNSGEFNRRGGLSYFKGKQVYGFGLKALDELHVFSLLPPISPIILNEKISRQIQRSIKYLESHG